MNTFTPFEITDTCDPTQTATPRPQKRNHRRHSSRKSRANRQPLVMSSPHSKRPTVLGIDVKSALFSRDKIHPNHPRQEYHHATKSVQESI